jgi:hypothetical protein
MSTPRSTQTRMRLLDDAKVSRDAAISRCFQNRMPQKGLLLENGDSTCSAVRFRTSTCFLGPVCPQVVGYREHPRNAVGFDTGKILVHLSCRRAFQENIAVLDDDMDARYGSHGVSI